MNSSFVAVLYFSHNRVFNNEHNSYHENEHKTVPTLQLRVYS